MANKFMEKLYDLSKTEDEKGISKFDEMKLRKAMLQNEKLMVRNKIFFEKDEPKFSTCKMYSPCPLCDKCLNKASHLYVKCQSCIIPVCVHTHKNKIKMLKRENFKVRVSNEVFKKLLEGGFNDR